MKSLNITDKSHHAPFPNGWFKVAFSDEIKRNEIKSARYFGRDLIIFRDERGEARVLDAICPHMGMNIGVGGRCKNGIVRCPFHGWRFNGDGKCVRVPLTDKVPKARLGKWITKEINHVIFVWYHNEGKEPYFDIPRITEFYGNMPGWSKTTYFSFNVECHMWHMQNNPIDVAHLYSTHEVAFHEYPKTSHSINGPIFEFELEGEYKGILGVTRKLTLNHTLFGCGVTLSASCFGFGFKTLDFGLYTPIDEGLTEYNVIYSVHGDYLWRTLYSLAFGKSSLGSVLMDSKFGLKADRILWENCKDIPHSLFVHDTIFAAYRSWTKQFYSTKVDAEDARKHPWAVVRARAVS